MARATNPCGDGHACERVLAAFAAAAGRGERLPDLNSNTLMKEQQ